MKTINFGGREVSNSIIRYISTGDGDKQKPYDICVLIFDKKPALLWEKFLTEQERDQRVNELVAKINW
jgi:hypothetical protein